MRSLVSRYKKLYHHEIVMAGLFATMVLAVVEAPAAVVHMTGLMVNMVWLWEPTE